MELSSDVTIIPYLHGKLVFARQIRTLCLKNKLDCIASDIPLPFQEQLSVAVEKLPVISALIANDGEEPLYYIPIDPCDAAIEGVRQSLQNRIPFFCIGSPRMSTPRLLPPLPDEFVESKIGFDFYNSLCLQAIGNAEEGSDEDLEGQYIAGSIHQLRTDFKKILVLVHYRNFVRTVHHFKQEKSYNIQFDYKDSSTILTRTINPDHLYFALGELPFITSKYEKERYDLFSEPFDTMETIKDLFRETRDEYFDDQEQIVNLSPVRIQAALSFLRNLTIMSGRLTPTLFDIIEAAKGVGGNAYAVRILKSARYYPYISLEDKQEQTGVGINHVSVPEWGGRLRAINLFRDFQMHWKTISIKPDPSLERKKKYRFTWNPFGMCSHVPEDSRIERFNTYVRRKSLKILVEDFVKSEKFTTSVKDGIDIRETLRNWHTGNIYVKEIPPSKGKIDTVVIIFDGKHDEKYPHCATWYAEHSEESTLTFYATDPMENMIGPGIARCFYGGLSLLFPPRHIPDVFEFTTPSDLPDLSSRLTYGAMLFSSEKVVGYIAPKKPGAILKNLASKLKKHLLWIPMDSFSNETLTRLRRFHILNGKNVRSWAGRFIE